MAKEKLTSMDKAYMIAKMFSDQHNLICFEKHFYLYNEGIWRLESDENTKSWIVAEYIKTFSAPPKQAVVYEIISLIQVITYDKYRKEIKYRNEENPNNQMNLKSGILNLDTLRIKKYTKEDFCFYKLPFDYIRDPKCPIMMDFLASSMDYDLKKMTKEDLGEYKRVMMFLREWMGYTMIGGNPLQKALVMVGEGGNGKGVLQDIWEYVIGAYNCSHVDLKYMNDGTQIFMTRNKLVNFSKDLESNQQLDTGIVKSAIAGEKVVSMEKYKGQIIMPYTAKNIMACNDLPHVKNAGNAIRRRLHILPFTRVFGEGEMDRDLFNKLKGEAENIFSWAIGGLKSLKKRGDFDVPERCTYTMKNYIRNNDSIQLWIEEDDVYCEGHKAQTNDVLRSYQVYCEQSGFRSFGRNKFYERLEMRGYVRCAIDGVWFFRNMKIPNQTLL